MGNQIEMVACPLCHGEIRKGAIKCKHCKRFINTPPNVPAAAGAGVGVGAGQFSCQLFEKLKACGPFVLKGGDQLAIYKNGAPIAYLRTQRSPGSVVYELVENQNDPAPAFRFVRTEDAISGQPGNGSQPLFTWQNGQSLGGEIVSGCKWKCGDLLLSANKFREFLSWLPSIGWFIPSQYTILENGRTVGTVAGACFTFSNAKTVTLNDPGKLPEVLAAAIVLNEDAIG